MHNNLFAGTRWFDRYKYTKPGYTELTSYVEGVLSLRFNNSGRPYCNKWFITQMTNVGDYMLTVTVRLAVDSNGWSNSFGYTLPDWTELKEWIDTLHGCVVSRVAHVMDDDGVIKSCFAIRPSFRVEEIGSPSFTSWIRFGRSENRCK